MSKRIGSHLDSLVYDASVAAEALTKLTPKTIPITKDEALRVGEDFAALVRKRIDPDARVYVFGSTVKGEAHANSDIDIAVISDVFGNDVMKAYVVLSMLANEVCWDIEIHAIAPVDWLKGDPHVYEIKKWGIPA